jgi:hypothetical protein
MSERSWPRTTKPSTTSRKWDVPVVVTISGSMTVEARTKKQALKLAEDKYDGIECIEAPCYDTAFPLEDDLSDITESEDDESSEVKGS